MYRVLGHTSLNVILYIKDATVDVTINIVSPILSTINCKTYSVLKAIEVIFRCIEVNKLKNSILFNRTI